MDSGVACANVTPYSFSRNIGGVEQIEVWGPYPAKLQKYQGRKSSELRHIFATVMSMSNHWSASQTLLELDVFF